MVNEFEIKNCPFCNSGSLGVRSCWDGGYSVHCFECETQGPVADRAKEAVEKWNKWESELGAKFDPDGPQEKTTERRFAAVTKPYDEVMTNIKLIKQKIETILQMEQWILENTQNPEKMEEKK